MRKYVREIKKIAFYTEKIKSVWVDLGLLGCGWDVLGRRNKRDESNKSPQADANDRCIGMKKTTLSHYDHL